MKTWSNLLVLLALFLVVLSGLVGCGPVSLPQTEGGPASAGGSLVYGLTLAPSGIDPHVNASSELGIPLGNVYDTLVFRTVDGEDPIKEHFVPGLAKSWEISQDGLTYTFELRQDVSFHDGTAFDAEAVRMNIERIVDPETGSQKAAFLLGPFSSVEVLDKHRVALHLSAPYAPLLDGLAQVYLGMASPAALAEWGQDYQFHQVGTGPFQFVEYVPNDHLTIARNPDYEWGPDLYDQPGPARLEQVEFRFFTDPAARALALEAGDAQVMGELPPLDADQLEQSGRFQLVTAPLPGQPLGMILNTRRAPLDDVRVRKALLLGTDREIIVRTVFGPRSPVAYAPLTAVTFAYDSSMLDSFGYQPQEAASLLESAGWVDANGDGVREQDGQDLVLDAVLMGWGSVPEVGQLLQSQWADLGVKVDLQTLTYPAALEAARQGDYHLIPQAFSGSDPDLLWAYYHSNTPFNWTKAADAGLDGLLDGGRSISEPEARLPYYSQAQQHIMDQVWLIPIRDPVNLNGVSAEVKGLRFDAHGWVPLLHDVYLE